MGSKLSCEKCEPATTGTVINLSDRCVDKLKGVDDLDARKKEHIAEKSNDKEWMDKLKCIDDSHTNAYQISQESFEVLLKNNNKKEDETNYTLMCRGQLVNCLKRNPKCMIKCYGEMKKYIDCIDEQRVIKVKERIKSAEKEEGDEANEEIKSILDELFKNIG